MVSGCFFRVIRNPPEFIGIGMLLEEVDDADLPEAVAGGEVGELHGLHGVGHAPGVGAADLPSLVELETETCAKGHRPEGIFHGLAGGMGDGEVKHRTTEYEGRHIVLETVHSGPLELQVEGDFEGMHQDIFVSEVVDGPDSLGAEVALGSDHGVICAKVEAKAEAREHQFAMHAGLGTYDGFDRKEVLLEIECGNVGTCADTPADFSPRLQRCSQESHADQYIFEKFHLFRLKMEN